MVLNEFARKTNCGDHGGGVGNALAGDGEGGSMIRAGAGFRETEGNVDGFVEV